MRIKYLCDYLGNKKELLTILSLIKEQLHELPVREVGDVSEIPSVETDKASCKVKTIGNHAFSSLIEYHNLHTLPKKHRNNMRKDFNAVFLEVDIAGGLERFWIVLGRIGDSPFWRGPIFYDTQGMTLSDVKMDMRRIHNSLLDVCGQHLTIPQGHSNDE